MTKLTAPGTFPNLAGRPRDSERSLENIITRELQQQAKHNDRLRGIAARLLRNIEKIADTAKDNLETQVRSAEAVVGLMEASAKVIDTVSKHAKGLRDVDSSGGSGGSDLKNLLGEHSNVQT